MPRRMENRPLPSAQILLPTWCTFMHRHVLHIGLSNPSWLVGFILLFAAFKTNAGTGDFAPLAVGSKWIFSEGNSNAIHFGPASGSGVSWNGVLSLTIMGKTVVDSTTRYTAHFRDSLYARKYVSRGIVFAELPDSIAEFEFEIVDSQSNPLEVVPSIPGYWRFLEKAFHRHSYPDSVIRDTLIAGLEMRIVDEVTELYADGIGLLMCWDGLNGFFNLEEHNGKKIPSPISVLKQGNPHATPRHRLLLDGQGKARNLLGRLMTHAK